MGLGGGNFPHCGEVASRLVLVVGDSVGSGEQRIRIKGRVESVFAFARPLTTRCCTSLGRRQALTAKIIYPHAASPGPAPYEGSMKRHGIAGGILVDALTFISPCCSAPPKSSADQRTGEVAIPKSAFRT